MILVRFDHGLKKYKFKSKFFDQEKRKVFKFCKAFRSAEVQKSTREFSNGLHFSNEVAAAVEAASLGSTLYYIGITDRVDNNAHTYESTGKVLYPM